MTRPVFAPTPELVDAVVAEVRARRRSRNATAAASAVLAVLLMAFSSAHLPWPDGTRGLDVTGPGPVASSPTGGPDGGQSPTRAATPPSTPSRAEDRGDGSVIANPPRAIAPATSGPAWRDRSRVVLTTDESNREVACHDGLIGSRWRRHGPHCILAEHAPAPIHDASGVHLLVCPPIGQTDAILTFPDSLELDVVVSRAGGGVVWRWSDRHPGTGGGRTLRIPMGRCANWVVGWALVDSNGRPVPYGEYEIALEPRAEQLAGFRTTLTTTYQPS